MTLYRDLHKPNLSLSYDSPNAELNFLKTVTSKMSSPPSRKSKPTFNIFLYDDKNESSIKKPIARNSHDCILQDSEKYDQKFVSSIKRTAMSDLMTFGADQETKKMLNKGVYNQNFRGMSEPDSWKPCRRTLTQNPCEEILNLPRQLRGVKEIADKYKRDPILEGQESVIKPKTKVPEISLQYEKYKEKLMFLPSDRKISPSKASVRPKDQFSFTSQKENGYTNFDQQNGYTNFDQQKGNNLGNKSGQFQGKDCKSLLTYDYALPYREEAATKKINKYSIAERTFVYNDCNDVDYRRKRVIHKFKD